MVTLSAFFVGVIFAIGLGVGGMTEPGRVVGFLDVFGSWDPTLIFVMTGALIVHITLYRVIRKRRTPLLADTFRVPTNREINFRLALGAALFGIGWGLVGFCPAPALTALASFQVTPFIFVAAMIAGMLLFKLTGQES